ncbi:MAG: cation:proton antiporter [Pseudomonadota bacterium]
MGDILFLTFVFLVAGVIAVPIASRLGLGSVLGYLIAGIAISPVLAAFGVDVVSIQHFAEFGVVMMLFLVGLELEPRLLWEMRARLLGLGGLQVSLTTLAVMGVAILFGQPWTVALAIGLVLALSSTAIVLQTFNEKGLMKSDGGQGGFSVLLFQDIAVIPMLALIPLLALPELAELAAHGGDAHDAGHGGGHGGDHGDGHGDGHGGGMSLTEGLAGWQQALVTLGAIAAVIVGGIWATRPLFRFIAIANMREIFVAAALLWVVGIALLMTLVGLSPALGTFLAGVVLANSEYRHELESDIDPFKGLLLGLFFITVGAGINFGLLFDNLAITLALTAGLIALKAAVLLGLSYLFGIGGADRWLFSLGLAQAGEFGFVLLSFTVANAVIPPAVADQLLLVVALSMLLTPGLFIFYEKVIVHRFVEEQDSGADEIDETGPVVIAGHGRFGGIVNHILREAGYETTVLDYSSAQLEMLRKFGLKVYFGDAARPDLLHAAGIHHASVLVIAIDGKDQITEMVRHVRHAHPGVHIIARAVDRHHVYELYAAGARDIIRETFDSSVRAGRSALEALGKHPFEAERLARRYVVRDRERISTLAALFDPDVPAHENEAYVAKTRELIAESEAALTGKDRAFATENERGWSPPTLADVDAVTEKDAKGAE